MKKGKYIYFLVIVLTFFSTILNVKADDMGICEYQYKGISIKVRQTSKKKVDVGWSGGTKDEYYKDGTYSVIDGKAYLFDTDISDKHFFNSGEFYCPQLNVIIEKQNSKDYHSNDLYNVSIGIFTDKQLEKAQKKGKTIDKITTATKRSYISECSYRVDNSYIIFEPDAYGGAKVKEQSCLDDGAKCDASLLNSYDKFMVNGEFVCPDDSEIVLQKCYNKKNQFVRGHWLFKDEQGEISDECGIFEKTEPSKEDPTKASWWDSTDGNTEALAKKIYNMIKIIVPLLVIVLSIADYLKVLFVSEEKNYKAAFDKFIKRISVGIILFLLPVLISLILNIAGLGDMGGIISIFS